MSLVRNTIWSAASAVVLTGGRFLITMLLAKKLGVSEFGKFVFAQWLVDMVFLSLAFGLPGLAGRFFAEFQTQTANLHAFERWYVPRALAVVAAVVIASPFVAMLIIGSFNMQFALLQSGWSAAAASWALLMARAVGLQQFKRVTVSNAVFVVIALVGCVLMPDDGLQVTSAMLVVLSATVAAAFATWISLPVSVAVRTNEIAKLNRAQLKSFGINIWITGLVSALVWSRGEIVVVRAELGNADVAIYSIALTLTGIASQGLMLLTGAIGQHFTQLWGAGKREEAIDQCRRFTDLLTLIAGIIIITLVAFAPELIVLIFGPAYAAAAGVLSILILGTLGFTSSAVNPLLQIQTNGEVGRNINFVAAIFLFATAIPLVKLAGIDGAALARVFIQVGVGAMTLYFSRRLVSVNTVNWKNQTKTAIVIFIIGGANVIMTQSLYIRVLEFLLGTGAIIFWLRNDRNRFIYYDLLNIFQTIILNKRRRNSAM